MQPECVPCLLKRVLFEAKLVDPSKEREVIEGSLRLLAENFEEGRVSAEVATKVHKRVYDILGTDDPYSELKRQSNKTAEKLLPRAEEIASEGGLREAILVGIAGNVLDFGFREDYDSPDYLLDEFENIIEEGLGYDDTDKIDELLDKAENVVFFTDNAGEIVLDTILLKRLKDHGLHLTVVVKEEPILTDATEEDALKYGIDGIADQLDTTGGYAIGVDPSLLSDDLKDKLEDADLIICKGMANWEAFSETNYAPIAFLTRSKCSPVAQSMGVPQEANVVKLFERAVPVSD